MIPIYQAVPQLAEYHISLCAIAILLLAILIQSVLQAPLAFASEEQSPGAPLKGGHSNFSFRVVRTFLNSAENLPMILSAVILAVIAGVNASWVNWLVGLHVFFRLLFWVVYYAGIGKVAGGLRTISFVGGWLSNLILAGMAFYSLLQ